jgi:membrane associated rhomboid family serine protease
MTFIGMAIVFFLLGALGWEEQLIRMFAQVNALIEEGDWWRIFTVVLLHGSVTHLIFNMWALYVLGPQIERGVGTWPFVTLYLASAGVGGAFAYWLGAPTDIGVGASGAIFGLFGIWLSWAVHRRNTMYGRSVLTQLIFLLVINAAIPFIFRNVSWQAHLGGLIAGFVIGEIWSRIQGPNAKEMRAWVGLAVAALAAVSVMI